MLFLFQNNNFVTPLSILTSFNSNLVCEFPLIDVFDQVLMLFLFANNNLPLLLLLTSFNSNNIAGKFPID